MSTTILRTICELNKETLEHLELRYDKDTLREESRIIMQEFGLSNFPNLKTFTLKFNKGHWNDELVDYLNSESNTLISLNLISNFMNPLDLTNVCKSLINCKYLERIDFSHNVINESSILEIKKYISYTHTIKELNFQNCYISSRLATFLL